jgi:L-rhamnose isomerase/sugar isomerase
MITSQEIQSHNDSLHTSHQREIDFTKSKLEDKGLDVHQIINNLGKFQVAIPSWALGTGGTRFGRFPGGGEPGTLEQKITDVGLLHKLNKSSGAISLHIPWDIPSDAGKIKALAAENNILFDAVNSNTFQDQPDAKQSYKFGSLCHTDPAVRKAAVDHNKEVIKYGKDLDSKALTVWLADGSTFPGQHNFRGALERTYESLAEIYGDLPSDWTMLVEYKPYEPSFYSMVIPDWGTSHLLVQKLGNQARTLVDLGHHLPNTNIEQIVSILMMQQKLGGFHFNDSKYGDDDLTVGSLKPYQLFLIFCELVDGMNNTDNPELSWMIDASHNIKDPMEDLLQSVEAIMIAYAQAQIVDRDALNKAQEINDVSACQEILQEAFRTDVRSLVAEARLQNDAAIDPIGLYRSAEVRENLIKQRGYTTASGL